MKSIVPCACVALISLMPLHADWSQWRGPNGNGAVAEGKIPTEFSAEGKGVAWKIELPGRGCSTPIVSGDHLFLTSPIDGKDALIAYDLEGKEEWRIVLGEETKGRGRSGGSGSNSSPVSDGKHVIGYFKSGRVVGATVTGKKLWEANLYERYGKDHLWWDQGTSPVLAAGNIVIAVMQSEGNSYLVSLNPATGEEVWKTDRKYKTAKETGDSYTTPHVVTVDGVETIISFGADHVTGHDAKSGKELWACAGINPKNKGMWRTIASSVYTDGIVIVPHGRGEWVMGIKAGGSGDITEKGVLWRKKLPSPDVAAPVARDGKVFLFVDRGKKRGQINCIEAKTGKVLWNGSLPRSSSAYYASPILVGNQLCFAREDGVVIIAEIKEDGLGKIVENKIGEAIIASPISVNNSLIIRGEKHLWCLR